MHLIVFSLANFFNFVCSGSLLLYRHQAAVASSDFDGRVVEGFTANRYFGINSVVECLALCTNDINCQSFFYGNKICQKNSVNFFSDARWVASPGISYYQLIQDNCSQHEGYVYNRANMICYKIHFEVELKWPDARQKCRDEGGDLISLDTIDKYQHLVDVILSSTVLSNIGNDIFVGGINDLPGGEYRWVNNVILPRDSQMWGTGKPGGGNSLHYVRISNAAKQGFDDTPVNRSYFFVCEIV